MAMRMGAWYIALLGVATAWPVCDAAAQLEGLRQRGEAMIQEDQVPRVEPIPAAEMRRLVRDLGSPDVTQRLRATAQLMERPDVRLRDLEAALEASDLTPEQRRRLLGVAEHRFRSEPRAALGFQVHMFVAEREQRGVTIGSLIPNFPAMDILRAGDRIIEVNGVPLPDFAAIRPIIVSRDPGDELRLVVVRDGATLNLTVPLGSFRRLPQAGGGGSHLDDAVLRDAWELRSRRLRGPASEPVHSGLLPSQWESEPIDAADSPLAGLTRGGGADEVIGVVVGGEARGDGPRTFEHAMHLLLDDNAGIRPQMAGNPILQRLQQLRIAEISTRQRVDEIDARLAMPNLPADERLRLLQQHSVQSQHLLNIKVEMQRMMQAIEGDR